MIGESEADGSEFEVRYRPNHFERMSFKMSTNQDIKVLERFDNPEAGICGIVSKVQRGFSAVLLDTDCGEFLPYAYIYPSRDLAVAKAKQLAGSF